MPTQTILPISYHGRFCYNIELTDSFDHFYNALCSLSLEKRRLCIVSDSNVDPLYGDLLEQQLLQNGVPFVGRFVFPAGEEHKTLSVIRDLYEYLILHQFDRSDALIALGGGVVGDMTGYAAATYLRGISFIQVPTSLLAMVDSSIGGKTGVDFNGYKNMVGAFHQPSLVYVNTSVLSTLERRQFSSGMGEVIKHGLIHDTSYLAWLEDNFRRISDMEPKALIQMISESQKIKKEIVESDPHEKGIRVLLNFGHTIGHAIEKAVHFSLLHGECVALGMVASAFISFKRGEITKDDLSLVEKLNLLYGLPVRFCGLDVNAVLENCRHDKKKNGTSIRFVLLEKPGRCHIAVDVNDEEICNAIYYLKEEKNASEWRFV